MDSLIHHMLLTSAKRSPDKEALVHGNQRLTYREVAGKTGGLANGLRQAGLLRGDRVGIYLDPSVAQVVSIFGVSEAGGVYVPINATLFPEQVGHIARDCGMKGLITTPSKLSSLIAILADISTLEFLILTGEGEAPSVSLPVYRLEELESLSAPHNWRENSISKDLAAILYTSGSTGKPKGVMLSHDNVMAGSTIVSTYLGITSTKRILAVLPFSLDAGMNQLMTAFQQGGTIILINFVFAREAVQMLLKEKITGTRGRSRLYGAF